MILFVFMAFNHLGWTTIHMHHEECKNLCEEKNCLYYQFDMKDRSCSILDEEQLIGVFDEYCGRETFK